MNIDVLKTAWHASIANAPEAARIDRLAHAARTRARHYERAALSRVACGSAVFALALAMLAILAMAPEVWLGMRIAMAVWSASMIACAFGLWRIRAGTHVCPDTPLEAYLEACLRRIHREIAYQRSLRWWWWLPFGVGLLAAGLGRVSAVPGISWIIAAAAVGFWLWGFVHGPRHWPERLQPEADALQGIIDGLRTKPE